jgi:hypothetical protein
MSHKAGISSQVISLPQGGGTLHGIGEICSPNLHTGTGNSIALPPRRHGFQPQLNLVYSTGNSNGPFGLGWNLSIPGVSRKPSKGIPKSHHATEVFLLPGAEDLVPMPSRSTVLDLRSIPPSNAHASRCLLDPVRTSRRRTGAAGPITSCTWISLIRLRTIFSRRVAWWGSFIRIPVGFMSSSRRPKSALWNVPTPRMEARCCLVFSYPLPDCTKP